MMLQQHAEDLANAAHHAAVPLWQDPSTWVLLGVVVVLGILYRAGAHKTIAKALDARAVKIKEDLDQAQSLREEAQELLAEYQRRQRAAEDEAQAIIEHAKRDAKRLAEESRDKINAQIARRTAAAEARIARAEGQAIAEVRGQTADLAVAAARTIIRNRMDAASQNSLIDKAISGVQSRLN